MSITLSSIAFDSVYRSMASAYGQTRTASAAKAQAAAPLAEVIAFPSPKPSSGTVLATDLSRLLNTLASGNVEASQASVTRFAQHLRAQTAQAQDGSGNALYSLLSRVSGTLAEGGSTVDALGQVQSFLLNAGQTTGTGFSARV